MFSDTIAKKITGTVWLFGAHPALETGVLYTKQEIKEFSAYFAAY